MVDDVPVVRVLRKRWPGRSGRESGGVAGRQRDIIATSTDVPWKQALRTVVNSAGFGAASGEDILHVHSQARQKNTVRGRMPSSWKLQANLPLENRGISLQYADAGELAKAGEKLLSAKGTIMVDKSAPTACCCAITARPRRSWKNGYHANGSAGGAGGTGGACRHH
ncbi:hypothetical protein KCP78_17090 [Salmonella enterica subsp. enterica]|nr:hypothetical protein KCP78_17090 [Salmonella enterica subsp. enterica]